MFNMYLKYPQYALYSLLLQNTSLEPLHLDLVSHATVQQSTKNPREAQGGRIIARKFTPAGELVWSNYQFHQESTRNTKWLNHLKETHPWKSWFGQITKFIKNSACELRFFRIIQNICQIVKIGP